MNMRYEVFMAVKTEIMASLVNSVVDGYQLFGGTCCICLSEDKRQQVLCNL
jgi:hypothetical protein